MSSCPNNKSQQCRCPSRTTPNVQDVLSTLWGKKFQHKRNRHWLRDGLSTTNWQWHICLCDIHKMIWYKLHTTHLRKRINNEICFQVAIAQQIIYQSTHMFCFLKDAKNKSCGFSLSIDNLFRFYAPHYSPVTCTTTSRFRAPSNSTAKML